MLIERGERSAEGDSRGQKGRVMFEAGEAHAHGFVVLAHTPEFFGERCKSNRRRVLLDPASKHVKT